MLTTAEALRRSSLVFAAGLSTAAAVAEPIRFTNDGSLQWAAGGNQAHFPIYDPCDPLQPSPGYRAFDITRGPEQMSPTSSLPISWSSFCRRGYVSPTTSGDSSPRYIITEGNNGGWAIGPKIRPYGISYYHEPNTLRAFAPGMIVGPDSTFSRSPLYCENPYSPTGRDDLWLLAPRQFVGVRFDMFDGVHYGWILLDRTGGELHPVEWAYESQVDTPIAVNSLQAYSPPLRTTTGQVTTINLHSGNSAAGTADPTIRRLLGPTTGPFAAPFTSGDFSAARNSSQAFSTSRRPDWYNAPLIWTSTSNVGANERTALYAIDFQIPADFDPEFCTVTFGCNVAVADRLGPENSTIPGVYLNGVGLPRPSTAPTHSALSSGGGAANLQSIVAPGTNTLYFYIVSYGGLAPYGTGHGFYFNANFGLDTMTPPSTGIAPAIASVSPGQVIQMYGGALHPVSVAVTWSASAGSITQTGLYTAPTIPGSYTVRVTSTQVPVTFAEATIVVCPPDFNHDLELNPDDLGDFITCFFREQNTPGACPAADFNRDAGVDPDDLGDFITSFFLGGCP